jgi:hypothetical protein
VIDAGPIEARAIQSDPRVFVIALDPTPPPRSDEAGEPSDDAGAFSPVEGGGHLVSGGGLIGELHARHGLVRLRGPDWEIPIEVEIEGAKSVGLAVAPGGWIRTLEWETGGRLIEEGLLADGGDAVALNWRIATPSAGRSAEIRIAGTQLQAVSDRMAVAITPLASPDDHRAIRRFFRALPARGMQRRSRFRDDESPAGPIRIRWEGDGGESLRGVAEARTILDTALPDPSGSDLVLGVGAEGIRLVGSPGSGLDPTREAGIRAEMGIAFLLLGWHEASWRQLVALAEIPDRSPHGFLHLATQWAGWTGHASRLLELEGALRTAAGALRPGPIPEGGAAWPTPARLAHDLADAIEPTGAVEWRKALLVRSALLSPTSNRIALPPVTAFRILDDPSQASTRSLAAARLVRSWISGRIGAHAEMAYGRLILAPVLGQDRPGESPDPPPLRELRVTGLRAGDGRVDMLCRQEEARFTFRLAQTHGRVPMNLVFEPWLPLAGIREARLGGDPADVDARPEGPGTRVRLQFPLDAERRLEIDGEYGEQSDG